MLNDWDREGRKFWQVVPKDYAKYLVSPMQDEEFAERA